MSKKKNIYGTELKKCNNLSMNDSSNNGHCYESGGGYHNICINMHPFIANNFSELTGQSDWSKNKINNNHCICQGAWANYIAKLKQNNEYYNLPYGILNCEAIPEEVLTIYKDKFKTWNNLTIENQHFHAYNELLKHCPKINKKKYT
jgi:hypothetical protein